MWSHTARLIATLCLAAVLLSGCQPARVLVEIATRAGVSSEIPVAETGADAKIQGAMAAAPRAVSAEATILDWPAEAGGEPPVLREGSNDWTCLPDNPGTPGEDPMCVDQPWAAWLNAYMTGTEPQITAPGISYMLVGGQDASNTDPFATEPAPGEQWVATPPHIMLLMPGGFDPANFTTDHHSGGPYIMWEGTPYEHLMIPVVPARPAGGILSATASIEEKIQNVMEAAPRSIAENAAILDWPAEAGGEPPVLREGSNDWTCLPDNPGTPGEDPMCVDQPWAAWLNAYMTGTEPQITAPGISYMLAGGQDASNTDPFATEPAPGEQWVATPAHIMLLAPSGLDTADFTTDHHSGGPYIMWEGTPYEHLMIPVEAGGSH